MKFQSYELFWFGIWFVLFLHPQKAHDPYYSQVQINEHQFESMPSNFNG